MISASQFASIKSIILFFAWSLSLLFKSNFTIPILVMRVDLKANYAHSLKEKRMIVKSLTGRLQNKFNISIREVENQDLHQLISIGIVKLDFPLLLYLY